ncbi:MAG: GNAT family N-acetyltransferase [Rhodocyclales bacterium GT-UBC]|nr:MAG: GNAT family N-acetyltransferase [Rhodocyclales bacterium GT-UBC]
MQIDLAIFLDDSNELRQVIGEYIAWLDMDLSYRGFADEMAGFDRLFTLPSGLFLIAREAGQIAGCVGLLRHDKATAEVKRLYVRPAFRGRQLGEALIHRLIAQARQLGFRRLILDAVPQTTVAQVLYERLGFTEIAPYYPNPVTGTRFFSLPLN